MQLPLALDLPPQPSWKCVVCGAYTAEQATMLAHVSRACGPMVLMEHYEAARARYIELGQRKAPVGPAAERYARQRTGAARRKARGFGEHLGPDAPAPVSLIYG